MLVVSPVLVVVSLRNGNNVGTGTPSEHDGKDRSPRSPYRGMKCTLRALSRKKNESANIKSNFDEAL